MNLLRSVILALLWLCGVVLAFYVILWVLSAIGIALPYTVVTILKVMLALIALLVLLRLFYPYFASWGPIWPPNQPPPTP